MKKFSGLIKENKLTVDDIDDFFLDFVDDKYSISDLVKFKKVEISSIYSTPTYQPKICIEYEIDRRFYSISSSNVDLFTKLLSSVNENCIRWNLEYKIILGNDRKLIIFKEVPDIIKKYHDEIGLIGFMGWSGSLKLQFDDDVVKFFVMISVDRDLKFKIKIRFIANNKKEEKIISRLLNNKEKSISVVRDHFKSHGLKGDIRIEKFSNGEIIFELKLEE